MASTPEPVPRSVSGPLASPASLQPQQQFEAEPRGWVGAGAESLAGVDDEVDRALAWLLPGGAQPESLADQQRFVEVLPAVGPVVGNLGRDHLDQAVSGCDLDLAELRQLPLAAVDRVLDVARARLLLDAVGRQHGQLGKNDLGLLGRSSGRRGGSTEGSAHAGEEALVAAASERRLRGSSDCSSFSASSRCSSERSLGTITWMTMRRSPGRPAVGARQAVAAQGELGAVLDAGGQLDLALALVAGDLRPSPRASPAARRSRPRGQVLAAHRPAPHLEAEARRRRRARKMSSTEPKPAAAGGKPPWRRPSCP